LEGMKAHAVGSPGGEPLGVSVMERASNESAKRTKE